MKKKQKTYLLLLAVMAIWGILGFRIIKTISPSGPKSSDLPTTADFKPIKPKERDTFSILADYRDPFLGTLPKLTTKRINKKPKSVNPSLPEKSITYSGLVNDQTSKQMIFFLDIDGQQVMLSKNETRAGVKLVSGNAENIRVRYNGLTKTIKRAQ